MEDLLNIVEEPSQMQVKRQIDVSKLNFFDKKSQEFGLCSS